MHFWLVWWLTQVILNVYALWGCHSKLCLVVNNLSAPLSNIQAQQLGECWALVILQVHGANDARVLQLTLVVLHLIRILLKEYWLAYKKL